MSKILILPGDGIGKEIVTHALKVIDLLNVNHGMGMNLVESIIGGSAYNETGSPLSVDYRGVDRFIFHVLTSVHSELKRAT